MTRPIFANPVDGPRIVAFQQPREPTDVLPNGRPAFRVTDDAAGHASRKPPLSNEPAIDLGNFHAGDAVRAMAPGRVIFVEPREGIVRIDHGGGWVSGYAHMRAIRVSVGQNVPRGHQLGEVSNAGTTDIHLHVGISHNGKALDPWLELEQNREASMALEGLAVCRIASGVNLRRDPSTSGEAKRLDFTADDYHLLGIEPNGGRYSLDGGKTWRTDWARVRRGSDWWVAAPFATNIRLTTHGIALIPLPVPDCSALENKLAASRTALDGAMQAHNAAGTALNTARSSLT